MTTRAQFALLLKRGFNQVMLMTLEQFAEEYSQYAIVKNSDSAFEEDVILAGLSLTPRKPEGSPITFQDPIEGGTKRYVFEPFASGWEATHECMKDEKYGIMRRMPAELMVGARETWEMEFITPLNLGTTSVTTANGVAFFSDTQPLLGGGTFSNLLTPSVDLSRTGVQDMLIKYENMVNERGLKARLSPTTLYIHPANQFKAIEIFGSSHQPETGNNAINPIAGRLTPVVLHYLTDSRRWFVGCDNEMYNKLCVWWRERPSTETWDDPNTKGVKHSLYFRIGVGVSHWIGWMCSAP